MLNVSEVPHFLLTAQSKTLRNFHSHISSCSHLPRDDLSWCSLALLRVSKFTLKSAWPPAVLWAVSWVRHTFKGSQTTFGQHRGQSRPTEGCSSIPALVPELWGLLAQVQQGLLALTLCCATLGVLEIVLASVDSHTLQDTWQRGELDQPDMGHPTFTFSDHRKLQTSSTAGSPDLVRSLVITGSFMNALTSRSPLARIFVCASII